MTNYVTWTKDNQPIKGDVLQYVGNPVANHATPSTGVATSSAPEGATSAVVWADVATTVQVSHIKGKNGAETNNYTMAIPANYVLAISNVVPGKTTIEMTDI